MTDHPSNTTPSRDTDTPDKDTPTVSSAAALPAPGGGTPTTGQVTARWALLLALLALLGVGGLGYLGYQHALEQRADAAALDARLKTAFTKVVQEQAADLQTIRDQMTAQQKRTDTLHQEAHVLTTQQHLTEQSTTDLRTSITNLQNEIKGLQGTIATLKGEVDIHKGGVDIQKADTQNLIAHVRALQTDVQNLQGQQQAINATLTEQRNDSQIRASAIEALQATVQNLTANLQNLSSQLTDQTQAHQRHLSDFQTAIARLELAQHNLLITLDTVRAVASKGGDVNAFVLSEIEYLLRLAINQLNFQEDVVSARRALETANKRLAQVDEVIFSGIRTMLNDNIAALHGVTLPDRPAIALEIVALERRIDELPLRDEARLATLRDKVRPRMDAEATAPQTDQAWWERASHLVWTQFKDIVSIRYERSGAQPLMSVSEEYFLIQNLRLELESMRMALMSGDSALYQQAAGLVRDWVSTYFDVNHVKVASFLSDLAKLSNTPLHPVIPDISNTLTAFQAVMARREPVRSLNSTLSPETVSRSEEPEGVQ